MRAFVHTAWASVLLFGLEGNTRASSSGTARLQSRFFVLSIEVGAFKHIMIITNKIIFDL